MDERLNDVLQKVLAVAKRHPELGDQLRSALLPDAPIDGRLNHIYEYCIEEVLKAQAEDFYSGFPIEGLVPSLESDFVCMEAARRKGDFGRFSLELFKQIEQIAAHLCNDPDLNLIAQSMWGLPVCVQKDGYKKMSISDRKPESKKIASFVLIPSKNMSEKIKNGLGKLQILDKLRVIVYFVGYQARMVGSEFNDWCSFTELLHEVYAIRCAAAHGGGEVSNPRQQEVLDRIQPMKELYAFKFMGALAQFVTCVRDGMEHLPQMKEYAESIIRPQQTETVGRRNIFAQLRSYRPRQ